MDIIVFVVNYNADDHLIRFVHSVSTALVDCDEASVNIHVFENSQKTDEEITILKKRLNMIGVKVILHVSDMNSGYFGGLKVAQSLVCDTTTCVIYCNPDILIGNDFFSVLTKKINSNIAMLAPEIISINDGFDLNPLYRARLGKNKLRRLKLLYSNLFVYNCYTFLARMKESAKRLSLAIKKPQKIQYTSIYAPHGAILIFTDMKFFKHLPVYHCFLFGEELFIGEEARLSGKIIFYEPELKVADVRHASVSFLSNNHLRGLQYKSVSYILNRYY